MNDGVSATAGVAAVIDADVAIRIATAAARHLWSILGAEVLICVVFVRADVGGRLEGEIRRRGRH